MNEIPKVDLTEFQKKEVSPVTIEEMTKLLTSEKFVKMLSQAAQITNAHGNETGYDIIRDIYSTKKFVSEIGIGTNDSMAPDHTVKSVGDRGRYLAQASAEGCEAMSFINLHFHPQILNEEPICPSVGTLDDPGDLNVLDKNKFHNYERMFEDPNMDPKQTIPCYPFEIIGQTNRNASEIAILMIQENFPYHLNDEDADDLYSELDEIIELGQDQQAIIDTLKKYNFNAEVIGYSQGQINPEDLPKLANFNYKTQEINLMKDPLNEQL